MSFAASRTLVTSTRAAVAVRPATGEVLPRYTVTTQTLGEFQNLLTFGPQRRARWDRVVAADGDTLTISDTAFANSLVDGYFDGCAVRFYRITDGVMSLVREDVVAGWRSRNRRPGIGSSRITDTTYRWAIDDGYRRGATVWFAVSTIAADGTYSPPSAWQSYTTPATHVAQSISNATASNTPPTTQSGAMETPANFALTTENDGRIALMTWDAVSGAHGYYIWRSQYDPAEAFVDDTVTLVGGAGKAAIQPNDLMIVERALGDSDGRAQQSTDRVYHYGSTYNREPWTWGIPGEVQGAHTLVADPVEGTVVRSQLAGGETVSRFRGVHGGTAQSAPNWEVLAPGVVYGATIRAKGAVGGEQITLTWETYLGTQTRAVTLTTAWADHTVTFDATPAADTTNNIRLAYISVTGPCDIQIAHVVWHRAQPGDVAMGLSPDLAALWDEVAPSALRMHQFCKSKPWTYSLDDITRRVGIGGVTRGGSLPQVLGICAARGIDPWIQFEWIRPEAEFLGLVEYLCAPYDPETDTPEAKPWAYRRHAQGRTAPWSDAFGVILFELGNEQWQSPAMDQFWGIDGFSGVSAAAANAALTDYFVGVMQSSEYWTPEVAAKFQVVIGARNKNNGNYTATIAPLSTTADHVTIANYNGGWDRGAEGPAQANNPDAWALGVADTEIEGRYGPDLAALCAAISIGRPKPLRGGTYEAGPGYNLDGFQGASLTLEEILSQEAISKSVGFATATLDIFLGNSAAGLYWQNFYSMDAGFYFTAYARRDRGGALSPPVQWLGYLNRRLLPGRVSRLQALVEPLEDVVTVPDVPVFGAYRVDGAARSAVILINRSVAGPVTATLRGAVPSGAATRWTMTGGYEAHNTTVETADEVSIVPEAVTLPGREIVATVPPGEVVVYEWETA